MTSVLTKSSSQSRQTTLVQKDNLPFITIALITFNKKSTIRQTLRSLSSLDYPRSRYEIIAVDGGSRDGTIEILRDYGVSIIEQPGKNRGVARNTAVQHSKGDIIAFIDADCLATTSWLKDHVSIHEDQKVLVAGGSVLLGGDYSLSARIYHETYFAAQSPALPRRITWDLATCNVSFKRTTFWEVGLFPEINRGEDALLCWQVLGNGYIVLFDPIPRVVHLHEHLDFRALFKRTIEQGYADREIQQAFGSHSPFRLPRGFYLSALLGPSLVTARFLRYFVEVSRSRQKESLILKIPILMGTSILWVIGYLAASHNLGTTNA